MKISSANVRNFCVVGHSNSGKTSLCDLMLFKAKKVDRLGKPSDKTSLSDYTPEEQIKQNSIYATSLNCEWNNHFFSFIDAPGYGEFISEPIEAISNSDMALIVVDAVDGLLIGSARGWKIAKKNNVPTAIYINGLDKEIADYDKVIEQIQNAYGKTNCIPVIIPDGIGDSFSAVSNILSGENLSSEAQGYLTQIMDSVAESDEELMMKYLDGEKLSEEEISNGLKKAIAKGTLTPVFCGSVEKQIGITELMNAIVSLFPCPLAKETIKAKDGADIKVSDSGAGLARVFKVITDPFLGQLVFFKVVSGSFKADSEIHNITKRSKERFGSILLLNGKNQDKCDEAVAGMICGMVKLKSTGINDTLSTSSSSPELIPMKFPKPVMSFAITAAKSGEEDKIGIGLNKIAAADPTIKLERHPETHEMLLSGMGDQQLGLAIKKLKEDSKVEVKTNSPKIPYRETITSNGEGHYRHKKQTGGHGQFAEVYLRVSPNPEGYEFKNDIVGGTIPRNFIPAVEKGVVEAMIDGPLAGCNVENITVSVYDGKFHDVDSSEMAFKIAARAAFREAIENSKPILLEPIQNLKIMIPDQYMGDISGDLNQKRGRILGMDMEEGMQVVKAEVPLAELSKYATELRSITQGNGSFDMAFARYEMVPSNVAKEIIDNHKKELEEEEK